MSKKHGVKALVALTLVLFLSFIFSATALAATVNDVDDNSLRVGIDVYDLGAESYTYDNVLDSLRKGGSKYYFKIDGRWYDLLRSDIRGLSDLQDQTKAASPAEVRKWWLDSWFCLDGTVQPFEPIVSTYKFEYDLPSETVLPGKDIAVGLTFAVDEEGAVGYDAVRFAFSAEGPGDVTFTAEDSAGIERIFINEGSWGPGAGFPLATDHHEVTAWTLNFSFAGEHTITFSLVDAVTGDLIADISESAAIEAVWTQGDARDAFLDALQDKAAEIDAAEVAVADEDIDVIFGENAESGAVYAVIDDLLDVFRDKLREASLTVKLPGDETGETFFPDQGDAASDLADYLLGGMQPEEFLDNKTTVEAAYSARLTDKYNVTFELAGCVLLTHRYTVTFDVNGGSEVEAQTVGYRELAEQPSPDPTKKCYIFSGWFADEALTVEFDFESPILVDTTIYAKWDSDVDFGDGIVNDVYIVNRDYTDNEVKNAVIGKIPATCSNEDVSDCFDFTYYLEEGGDEITEFDLSGGGTTFSVFMEATSEAYGSFSAPVAFKYRSVTIGKNDNNYLTIEDALEKAKSGDTIYVKHNTSFADSDVAMSVYDKKTHEVKDGVTLLLPFSAELSTKIDEYAPSTGAAISRGDPYAQLGLPPGISLEVNGTLFANAKRSYTGSRPKGYVTSNCYSQINMEQGSRITVGNTGTLRVLGFITGKGTVEAESGAAVYELLFLEGWRGGNGARNAFDEGAFPLEQFIANNIEVDILFSEGAKYKGSASTDYSGTFGGTNYAFPDLELIGPGSSYLFQLQSGQAKKSYDSDKGCSISLEDNAIATVNNASVNLGFSMGSKDKHMPFAGNWHFVIGQGAVMNVKAWLALLPGSTMAINSGGTVNIENGGKLTVFDPYEMIVSSVRPGTSTVGYPYDTAKYYRVKPSFNYTRFTSARLTVEGELNVEYKGGIAGRVTVPDGGVFNLDDGCLTVYDYTYAMASGTNGYANTRQVRLWHDQETAISVTADESKGIDSDGTTSVTAHVKGMVGDEYKPLAGVTVSFSGGNGSWAESGTAVTDANGLATVEFTADHQDTSKGVTMELTAAVTVGGIETTDSVDVKVNKKGDSGGGFSCPFVSSFDGQEYHFEHEATPFAVNKALETTSYGTLRFLRDVGGTYHVRITEELDEVSYVNGFSLAAVDYPADSGVKEVFADIYGNPQTIKGRINPVGFIDTWGNSRLDEITTKGQMIGSDRTMLEQGTFVESYVATFTRPDDAGGAAKFMVSTQKTMLITQSWMWFLDTIDGINNMWWIEELMGQSQYKEMFLDFINMVNLRVELWDGEKWVNQGEIKAGLHILEEFLLPLDLSIIGTQDDEIKVRLSSGAGFYELDQVGIDFSQNEIAAIHNLEPVTAQLNGEIDIKPVIGSFENEQHVQMFSGDIIDLVYDVPFLDESLARGFIVGLKGYYHVDPNTKVAPIHEDWEGLSLEEIICRVVEVQPEAENILPAVGWLNQLIEMVYMKPLEYKIEKIIADCVLAWMDGTFTLPDPDEDAGENGDPIDEGSSSEDGEAEE